MRPTSSIPASTPPFLSATPSCRHRPRPVDAGSQSDPDLHQHAAVPTSAAAAAASTRREVRRDLSYRPRSTTSTLASTVPSPATTWKAREMASGRSNAGIARSLVLSQSAVEKHVNSIFSKLRLTEAEDTHRRVAAVLAYLGGAANHRA